MTIETIAEIRLPRPLVALVTVVAVRTFVARFGDMK